MKITFSTGVNLSPMIKKKLIGKMDRVFLSNTMVHLIAQNSSNNENLNPNNNENTIKDYSKNDVNTLMKIGAVITTETAK